MDTHTPWTKDAKEIFIHYNTSTNGLSSNDAEKRFLHYGKNIVGARAKSSIARLLWSQIKNPLILLLVLASGLSFSLGKTNEGFFVLGAIIVNILLGFWQEYKADNAVQKLEQYLSPHSKVIRDGKIQSIDAQNIVPGDYIFFASGDRIPADIRIIQSKNLEVDEAILTGESLPAQKEDAILPTDTVLADRTNMLWGGTIITEGSAEGVVVATADQTAIGAIAKLVGAQEQGQTPLEKSVLQFTKIISVVLILVGILIIIIGISNGYPLQEMLLTGIAVIVSAVPESLPIALSVVLAIGAETLAKKKAVVRKMAATETLGSTSVILTDKTGTLTEGKLAFVAINTTEELKNTLLVQAALNADVALNDQGVAQGRPLDIALMETIQSNTELKALYDTYATVQRLAFNSVNKYSGALFSKNGTREVALLGAADILIEKTSLSKEEKERIGAEINELAQSGERIIGIVSATVSADEKIDALSNNVVFSSIALIRFRDNIRPSVPEAVARIAKSGVRTIIVTGDHPGTALWVAKEIGVVTASNSQVLTGKEIAEMSDEVLTRRLQDTAVFARVTPEQKLRLVELLEKMGETVAVTGDGVNDAPALKAATIGVAMGSGTDVARASSDIVVLDDNYGSIVDAIFEGRGVLKKIRTVITYLMADSFDELLLIGGSIIMAVALPLTAMQILFVKFFSDIFPTLAFTFEKIDAKSVATLDRKARLLDKTVMIFTFGRGIVSSLLLFSLYLYLLRLGFDEHIVRTFTYASFASYLLFLAFSMRNLEESIFTYNPFSNHYLTLGVFVGFITITLSIYLPIANKFLDTVPLPTNWFLGVIGVGIANFILIEVFKYFLKKKDS